MVTNGVVVWGFVFFSQIFSLFSAYAAPNGEQICQYEKLNFVVYKDSNDPSIFWYVPPVSLYEKDGKVVFHRFERKKEEKVDYFFYIYPHMDEALLFNLMQYCRGRIPGLKDAGQLRPVLAKRFGMKVPHFDTSALGDSVTDFKYLGKPQSLKLALAATDAEEFEFLLKNQPGVQADVHFTFDSIKLEKWVDLSLSHKDVYNALNIGATGRYIFLRGEISKAITNYITNKSMALSTKGDLPIPEIINRVIEECFTPVSKSQSNPPWRGGGGTGNDDWIPWEPWEPKKKATWEETLTDLDRIQDHGWNRTKSMLEDDSSDARIEFMYRPELAKSDKVFYYKHHNFADFTETVVIPVYLKTEVEKDTGDVTSMKVEPLEKRDLIVGSDNVQAKAFASGIQVKAHEQYVIQASFALQADSPYTKGPKWYLWQTDWGKIDEDLYYRIGTDGSWTKVNGRAVIQADNFDKGELQFYLDRGHIWEKIPQALKIPQFAGLWPARFTYAKTLPQYNVVITGRRFLEGR